ncbi:MAG: phenylalanine--tRNA ligase subunit beta [Gemmatimonadota bacterium]
MNISVRWLKELAPGLKGTPEELSDRLAMYGIPVDESTDLGAPLGDVLVARVVEVGRHPNADRLSLCVVDAGGAEPVQVVCGAPNVRSGAWYPFAPVGATLPGGVKLKKVKIRGEESQGMLCSPKELGLGRDHAGIMELHGEYRPGEPFVAALGLDDHRLVLDVTPNRGDLLSHLGVARELGPVGEAGLEIPPLPGSAGTPAPGWTRGEGAVEGAGVRLALEDAEGCPRYLGLILRGVRVGPSPEWLAARLRAVGARPINNVVDATNYVLLELGQPLHAFDLDALGGAVVVRRARPGERLTTLDAQDRALTGAVLVIADAERPVALAGIMGGQASEVTDATTDIFLECALFDPARVREGRRVLGMSTDASYRFERGVDPEGLERAALRAAELIQATAGGTVDPVALDAQGGVWERPVVRLRRARVRQILGQALEDEALAGYLTPLGFDLTPVPDGFDVRVPGARSYDVTREIDLVEEIARRHGYDAFPSVLGPYRPTAVPDAPLEGLEDRLRTLLAGLGYLEARSAPFAPEEDGDVPLAKPLSAAESRLRRALAPGLLHRVEGNFARGERNVRLFELGTAFLPGGADGRPLEETRLAAAWTGDRHPPHWSGTAAAFDLWDVRGVSARVAEALGLSVAAAPDATEAPGWLEGRRAFVLHATDGAVCGWAGEVRATAVDAPAWAGTVWALEVQLTDAMAAPRPATYCPVPTQPPVERDLALLLPDGVSAAGAEEVVRSAAGEHLEAVEVFDVYSGEELPAGARSVAYRLRFRAPTRTLTDEEVDRAVERVLKRLREEAGVERRG